MNSNSNNIGQNNQISNGIVNSNANTIGQNQENNVSMIKLWFCSQYTRYTMRIRNSNAIYIFIEGL